MPELTQAESLRAALRSVVEFKPSATFDHLDPVGGDLLIGVASWMDKIDDERGNESREVQDDLRKWAVLMYEARDALAATPPAEGLGHICALCNHVGEPRDHDQHATPPTEGRSRLFNAVRQVIREGMDSPGVREELHLAFYEARAATPPTEGLDVTAERLVDAVLTWKSGAVVEGLAHEYRRLALAATPPTEAMKGTGRFERERNEQYRARAATSPTEGLDVERLARAIEKMTLTPVTLGDEPDASLSDYEWQATVIAREYALTPPTEGLDAPWSDANGDEVERGEPDPIPSLAADTPK